MLKVWQRTASSHHSCLASFSLLSCLYAGANVLAMCQQAVWTWRTGREAPALHHVPSTGPGAPAPPRSGPSRRDALTRGGQTEEKRLPDLSAAASGARRPRGEASAAPSSDGRLHFFVRERDHRQTFIDALAGEA